MAGIEGCSATATPGYPETYAVGPETSYAYGYGPYGYYYDGYYTYDTIAVGWASR